MSGERYHGQTVVTATEAENVLTLRETARDLRCSKTQVSKLIRGLVPGVSPLPAISIGRRKLVLRSTLERWKKQNETTPSDNSCNNVRQLPEVDAAGRVKGGVHA